MNPVAGPIARDIFLQATQPGPVREPLAVSHALALLSAQGSDYVRVEVENLERAIDAEFPWRETLVFQSRRPQQDEVERWVEAVRWLLQTLRGWDAAASTSNRQVQVLLVAIGGLDVECEGLSVVAVQFADTHVPESVRAMLESIEWGPAAGDELSAAQLPELSDQVRADDFKKLRQALSYLRPRFHSDIQVAVYLLWKLQPTELTRLIQARDNIVLSLVVCEVLEGAASMFALQVQNIPFKFMSLQYLQALTHSHPDVNAEGVLTQMLLQVAQTPHWQGWLGATYEHPHEGSMESRALASALAELSEIHWDDFISALALSMSRRSAETAADILTQFARKVGPVEALPMWNLAFRRWDAWSYGKGEEHDFLSSPQVCSLDYPVSMYYANTPAQERAELERELADEVMHIEQKWFATESELSTQRNRLASRLRLVRHGASLASGSAQTLPPPVRPDDDYSEVRYRYRDVNAILEGTMKPTGPMRCSR